MTEPRATINTRRVLDNITDPTSNPVFGFTATVTYENNVAEIQLELDPHLRGQTDEQTGFAQALKEFGDALIEIAANPASITFQTFPA